MSEEPTKTGTSSSATREAATDVAVAEGQNTAAASPGRMLVEAREQRDMTVDALAEETKLTTDIIRSIEADAFDRLPQPVFVRGYYRNCAKVLGLPEAQVMAAYADCSGVTDPRPVVPTTLDVVPRDVTPGTSRVVPALIVILVVIIVIGGVVVAWPALQARMPHAATSTAAAGNGNVIRIESTAPGADGPDTSNAMAGEQQAVPILPPPDQPSPRSTAPEDTQTAPESAQTEQQPDGKAKPTAVAAKPVLQLHFQGKSWVSVQDATGDKLLNGLVNAGASRTVQGVPPLQIVLGNAPEVTVFWDKHQVNISDEIQGNNTARFSVGTKASR